MIDQNAIQAKTAMLIRKPVAEVFEAFINPEITSKFWFTRGSGRLEAGKQFQWDWEMYNVSAQVNVKAIEKDRRILIEWPGYDTPTTVEWIFTPRADNTTFVTITNAGFTGDPDQAAKQAVEATEAFTWVLAGLKALLEHGINLNAIRDHFPDGLEKTES